MVAICSHIGCNYDSRLSDEDFGLLVNNYISEFEKKKWFIDQNHKNIKDSSSILLLFGGILDELRLNQRVISFKPKIIQYLDERQSFVGPYSHPVDSFLIVNYQAFKSNTLTQVKELNYIDKFTDLMYWDNWIDHSWLTRPIKYVSTDTMLLYENTHYDIPIRIERYENNFGIIMLSNTLQSVGESIISFDTYDASNKYQKIEFSCKAKDMVSNGTMMFKEVLDIKLIPKNIR